jgi:WD40-like Beta Propeller Repeat
MDTLPAGGPERRGHHPRGKLSLRNVSQNPDCSLIGLAVVMLVIGGMLWIYFSRNTTRSSVPAETNSLPPMKVVPFTSFRGREDQAAFSPDGNQIAFVWDGEKGDNADIYVKSIGGESPLRLTSDPAIDIRPTCGAGFFTLSKIPSAAISCLWKISAESFSKV